MTAGKKGITGPDYPDQALRFFSRRPAMKRQPAHTMTAMMTSPARIAGMQGSKPIPALQVAVAGSIYPGRARRG